MCGISVNLKVAITLRCSSYVTHSVGQPCTREFLQDEGLEREQEVPLGVSFHTCDVVGTCMGDSGGSWSRVMPQGVMSTSQSETEQYQCLFSLLQRGKIPLDAIFCSTLQEVQTRRKRSKILTTSCLSSQTSRCFPAITSKCQCLAGESLSLQRRAFG